MRMAIRSLLVGCCVSAGGIAVAQTPVALWEFDNTSDLTEATLGSSLTPTGAGFTAIAGPGSDPGAVTVGVGSYYAAAHGIAANGGGTRVNEYSLLFDFRAPTVPGPWYCFYQTDPANANDGEYFIRNTTGQLGVGALSYSASSVTANTWHRLIITFDINAPTATYTAYLDGAQVATQNAASLSFVDGRFSLGSTLLMLADENGEDGAIDIAAIAIYDGALSSTDAAALGGAGSEIILSGDGDGDGDPGPAPTVPPGAPVGGIVGLAALAAAVTAGGTMALRKRA